MLLQPSAVASGIGLDQPIGKLHGVGTVAAERLRRMNVRTGRDLRMLSRDALRAAAYAACDAVAAPIAPETAASRLIRFMLPRVTAPCPGIQAGL